MLILFKLINNYNVEVVPNICKTVNHVQIKHIVQTV